MQDLRQLSEPPLWEWSARGQVGRWGDGQAGKWAGGQVGRLGGEEVGRWVGTCACKHVYGVSLRIGRVSNRMSN